MPCTLSEHGEVTERMGAQHMAKLRDRNRLIICRPTVVDGFPRLLNGHGTPSTRYPGWLSRRKGNMLTRLNVLLKAL